MNTVKKIKYLPVFIIAMFFMAYFWDLIPTIPPKEMTAFEVTQRAFFVLVWLGIGVSAMGYVVNRTI